MSLQPTRPTDVPADTAAIALKVFRNGNPYVRLRDALGPLFADRDFLTLYANPGHPALSPARLALVTLLQYAEGLSDQQAAEAVRSRIDWKYLLGLSLDDPGFDASVLSEFRTRLIKGKAETLLLDRLLAILAEHGLAKARGRQRTDSTHVLAAVRSLNRLELVHETLRHSLDILAQVAPDWTRSQSLPDWLERYGTRREAYQLPKTDARRTVLAEQIGRDGQHLLAAIDASPDTWLRNVQAVKTLRQVWAQQYDQTQTGLTWRPTAALPPAAELICSPHDPDARYGKKREEGWVGYKVHVTETCEPDQPQVITQVTTTVATTPDIAVTGAIQADLVARGLAPSVHIVDSGYVGTEHLVTSQDRHGITLLGPVQRGSSWQERAGQGFAATAFTVDWSHNVATCPQGNESTTWRESKNQRGGPIIQVHFRVVDCQACPVQGACTRADRRSLTLFPRAQHEARQRAQERQETKAFWEAYRARAGVEGTLSQGVRCHDLRRTRYVGTAKTRLQHQVTAAAMNVLRVAAWLDTTARATTRRSPYSRLM